MKAPRLLHIRRTYKNLGRIREIVNVFLKHGLGQIIEALHLHEFAPIRWWYTPLHRRLKREEEIGLPERLRIALEELGPTLGCAASSSSSLMFQALSLAISALRCGR